MPTVKDACPIIAVVGGGYAGMSAAVTLAQTGVKCVVFETGKTLGGRARRIEYRGEVLDNGQHILAGAYTELLRLMRLVGVPDLALKRAPLRLSIPPYFLLSAPSRALMSGSLRVVWALLTAKGLTFSDKLAAVRLMRTLKRDKFQVAASKSVATLLTEQRQPQNLIDNLWQPLTISALNTPMANASAQVFANVLRDSLASTGDASDLLLPCVDLTALFPEPAATWLVHQSGEVHTGVRIKKILPDAGRYNVISETHSQLFDGVILAVGPHQLEGLMTDVISPALSYEPIVTVYYKFEHRVRLPEVMLGKIGGTAQWFFDRQAIASPDCTVTAPCDVGEGLIAAVISTSGPHECLSQDELSERVLNELAQLIPDLPSPVWRKVVTEKYATFACTPEADRPTVVTCYPGVFRAGDYVMGDYPATLEGAVRNGISAANAAIAHLQNSPFKSRL